MISEVFNGYTVPDFIPTISTPECGWSRLQNIINNKTAIGRGWITQEVFEIQVWQAILKVDNSFMIVSKISYVISAFYQEIAK